MWMNNMRQKWKTTRMVVLSNDHSKYHQILAQEARNMPAHCWMTRKISSQKGRCPIIFWFFGFLQDSEPAIQVASVVNIVYYMHENMLKKSGFFRGPQSNGICKIHSKSDQKGEFDWISLSTMHVNLCLNFDIVIQIHIMMAKHWEH